MNDFDISVLNIYTERTYSSRYGCIDLAAEVLQNVFHLPIPSEPASQVFTIMRHNFKPVVETMPGDIILMHGGLWHIGVVIGPDTMIHATPPKGNVSIESISNSHWGPRVRGYYRWTQE